LARSRYLILSDIHSNLEALDAVFRAVQRRRYDAVLCLGDLVGYGASPNPVVHRMRGLRKALIIRGNHDKVCCGLEEGGNFNASARAAAGWTLHRLTRDNREFLAKLPVGPLEVLAGVWMAHGTLQDEDAYLFSDFDAYQCFEGTEFQTCFFGHTHFPAVFRRAGRDVEFEPLKGDLVEVDLKPGAPRPEPEGGLRRVLPRLQQARGPEGAVRRGGRG
jgi:predicted phosphodiesterase